MKYTTRKLIVLLGLAGSLALPGLALADNYGRYSPKFPPQGGHAQHQGGERGHGGHSRYREHDRRDYGHHRGGRHHHHGHGHPSAYHHGHYHGHSYCNLNHAPVYGYGYGYGYYPGAYVSGVYVTPTLGLHIDLR